MNERSTSLFQLAVIVSALGFFVDVYDLLLFSIVRVQSLRDLGLGQPEILTKGELIISVQMLGLLIGGIAWGILGDKKGRLKVLFGSILVYSLATLLNGMVTNVDQYLILRFIAGIGLAGELGAGVTLVSEILPKEKRGLGSAMIASFGILGAVSAFFVSQYFDWRSTYYIGGAMGLVLLLLRVSVKESGMFTKVEATNVSRGNFLMFFNNRDRFLRLVKVLLMGMPTWYVIGVLATFSDQFGAEMGIEGISPGKAIVFLYLMLAFGDLSVGLLSQYFKSRKKALFIFYGITILFITLYFTPATRWIGFILLFYMRGTGLWLGVHDRVHHDERRTIRYKYSRHGRHQHPQHDPRCVAVDHPAIQVYA